MTLTLAATPRQNAPLEARLEAPLGRPTGHDNREARVVIEYCEPGNHLTNACDLARGLERELGIRVHLVPSRGGAFEVSVDGHLVFSKRATWRFPDVDEISYHVSKRR